METDPLGKSTRTAYTLRGEVHQQWGDATYPVQYTYNDYGERTALSTFRDGSSWTDATWPGTGTPDTSTWDYAPATGLLLSKTDAAGKQVSYTYNARGLLATRAWARGVTTTYTYSSTTAEQTGITYSDSTTALGYTYDRMGKTSQITDATGTRTQTHCLCGKLTSETLDTTFFGGRVLNYQLDSTGTGTLGRTTGFTLSGPSGSGTDTSVTYGYDSYGRFATLGTPSGSTFTYAYTANANLVASITHGAGWSETMTYDPTRNLLTSISGKHGSTVKVQAAYAYDTLGRRTSKVDSGEIYNRYQSSAISTVYTYNDRSELTGAKSYYGSNPADTTYPVAARGFSYSFDHIGNRTQSTVTGLDGSDVYTTGYTANSLNQVATRSLPAATPVTGLAPASAMVTVNGQTATRQGQYFYKNVPAGSTLPLWQTITASSNFGGSESRNVWYPVSPATFTYDLDGNLTEDDRWKYTWDAENRMTSMETAPSAHTAGVTQVKLTFVYDYLGRRVRKTVANYNGSAYVTAVDRKFIYDGWNLIAEHNALASGEPAVARYAWGLDLSGTLQGGGGVGGLLAVFDVTGSATHLPHYDGNGNLLALTDAATGALTATYEYDAFGNPQRSTGTYAATNPFRFSTKYTDTETSLVYYGRRFYDPKLGRFVGRDPIGEKGGLNLYGFLRNNAVNRWDFLGMEPYGDPTHRDAVHIEEVTIDGTTYMRVWRAEGTGNEGDEYRWGEPNDEAVVIMEPYHVNDTRLDGYDLDISVPGYDLVDGGGNSGGGVSSSAPSKTQRKMGCSELRTQMLKEVLPSSSGAKAALAGSGSYFRGNWRALDESMDWAFGSAEESEASLRASGQLAFFINMYAQSPDFRSAVNNIAITYVNQNWEATAGRVGTGVGVSLALNRGLGWGMGGSALGTMMSVNASLGDMRYMIRQGVHPALAMAASLVDGEIDADRLGDAVGAAFNDNELLMQFTGIDCDPTR